MTNKNLERLVTLVVLVLFGGLGLYLIDYNTLPFFWEIGGDIIGLIIISIAGYLIWSDTER